MHLSSGSTRFRCIIFTFYFDCSISTKAPDRRPTNMQEEVTAPERWRPLPYCTKLFGIRSLLKAPAFATAEELLHCASMSSCTAVPRLAIPIRCSGRLQGSLSTPKTHHRLDLTKNWRRYRANPTRTIVLIGFLCQRSAFPSPLHLQMPKSNSSFFEM